MAVLELQACDGDDGDNDVEDDDDGGVCNCSLQVKGVSSPEMIYCVRCKLL